MRRYGSDHPAFRESWSRRYDFGYARPNLSRGAYGPGPAPFGGWRGYDAGYPRSSRYDRGVAGRGHSATYFMGGYSYSGDYDAPPRRGSGRPRRHRG